MKANYDFPENTKNLKRKLNGNHPHDNENQDIYEDLHSDSLGTQNGDENDTGSSIKPFWTSYCEIYDKLAESLSQVQTTEECIVTSRIVDLTSAKLVQETQKLDLATVDHWVAISSSLVRNWHKFFYVPENDGWSFSDLIPLNRYKPNYFGNRNKLLKRKGSGDNEALSQKKKRTVRKDDNRAKLSKPLEGKGDDKPLPLIEHMERVVSAIESETTNGHHTIEYLRLVIDPNSFSSTVYNIFTISFLIREGRVTLECGPNDELRVRLRPTFKSQKNIDNEQGKGHFITSLTTSEWKALIHKHGIKSAMVSCPNAVSEYDMFYEKFSQSQKERVYRKKK